VPHETASSVLEGRYTYAPWLEEASMVTVAGGQLGGVVSLTVTWKVQLAERPARSVAVTVLVPRAKVLPDAGL